MRARATTVSLVLGSGGARGLAHIGVIQWFTEPGYEIRSIAGSSIGALVGGIHAARQLQVYADWVSALERRQVLRLLDPGFGRNGLIKGDRLFGVLRELIGNCAIEELPLSYTAVAADLDSGEELPRVLAGPGDDCAGPRTRGPGAGRNGRLAGAAALY